MAWAHRPEGGTLELPAQGSVVYVCLLTLVAALGGLLFGYDTAVISGAIGLLQTHFHLTPGGEAWAAASALVGCAVGAACAGFLSDRLGRKRVLILSAIAFLVSALGSALPRTFLEFVTYRIVGGLGIGAASLASPMYIAEISPARLRGRLVSLNQLAIVSGMLIVYFVNYAIVSHGTAIDEQALPDRSIMAGEPLELRFVDEFVSKYGPRIDRHLVDEFLAGTNPKINSARVADFLTQNGFPMEPRLVELAARNVTSWNVQYGWRLMFGSGMLPALLLLLLVLAVPESPRWLTEQDRREEALVVLSRVGGAAQARLELAEIEATIAAETGSLRQLFEPGLRLVLVIGVVLAVLQQVTGINVFLYFAPEIFKNFKNLNALSHVPLLQDTALLQTVVVGGVNLLFTIIAIGTVDRLGRKPLMLVGAAGMGLCLLALGLSAYCQQTELWILAFVLGYIACFALSVGPVTWVILAEIFPTKIRGRALALATVCLWTANFLVTQTFPILDQNPWLVARFHHGFSFWMYAALCLVQVVFVWLCVPETKGKTLEQIEQGWLRNSGKA